MPRTLLYTSRKGTQTFKHREYLYGCGSETSNIFHRLRLENLQRFISKKSRNGLWEEILGQNENLKLKIFGDRKNSKISENFHWKLYENRKFWDRKNQKSRSKNFDFFRSQNFSFSYNFQWKFFEIFEISENFHLRFSFWPKISPHKPFLDFLDINRCRISRRRRWRRLELTIPHASMCSREL